VNVRDATFQVMRRLGMTTIFGNPGSTEIPFLTDLPDDLDYVLGLHEGAVVGIATGYALGRDAPAFVNLHTAPGLGNAVNAIVNARDCRAPLVVVVGQQDRRQLATGPFLTGHGLERLAGDYPVWTSFPARPQDVPGMIARAYQEARAKRGPAIVVVPMGDWEQPADELAAGAPERVLRATAVDQRDTDHLAAMVESSRRPVILVGADADSEAGWAAVVSLAERLQCPVWEEPFARRAGFPQDHPQFAGHLPWRRAQMRQTLEGHDLVLAVGTGAYRMYLFEEGAPVVPGTRAAVITEDSDEAMRSRCELAIVAPVAPVCAALAERVSVRTDIAAPGFAWPDPPADPGPGEPLTPAHVYAALARRLAADTVLVEETPSSQPELYRRVPIRSPRGFFSGANGGLGFGLSGAIGLAMGIPDRPVVAVLGDGASMYVIQALWSAAQYGVGVLLIVMSNRRYAVMDALATAHGGEGAWPGFAAVDIAGMSRCLGCTAIRIEQYDTLLSTLDEVLPGLADRRGPLVLEVAV
jgi:thiamine pyrophosphate-dependent acetolactate synthase large subunit-like protein